MKLTPWFLNEQKPIRKGVYQVKCGNLGKGFSRWLGDRWSFVGFKKFLGSEVAQDYAERTKNAHSPDSKFIEKWRGVMK